MADPQALKLISLNIELDRHLDAVLPFLRSERADIVCLQEVREKNIAALKQGLQMEVLYAPMCILDMKRAPGEDEKGKSRLVVNEALIKEGPEGIAILTALNVRASRTDCYFGNPRVIPRWSAGPNLAFLSATFEKEGVQYTVGTTHFTWTPDGKESPEQRRDMKKLLEILARFPDVVFCGDFNAPRGGVIWAELAKRYKDNIPERYHSSLDPRLHCVGHLQRMVDGLFSTPHYRVFDVRLVEGISDHKAVIGFVKRIRE